MGTDRDAISTRILDVLGRTIQQKEGQLRGGSQYQRILGDIFILHSFS